MNYQQDWIMRQIQGMVQLIARMVFGKDYIEYEIVDETNLSSAGLLHNRLKELLMQFKICEAEDLLFAEFKDNDEEYLKLAVDFYQDLNRMSDAALDAGNFSRAEIHEGLTEALHRYGMSLPEF